MDCIKFKSVTRIVANAEFLAVHLLIQVATTNLNVTLGYLNNS